MSGKWLELLKEIAPSVTRAAVLRNPAITSGIGQFGASNTCAPSFGVELSPVDFAARRARSSMPYRLSRGPNGGLIVTGGLGDSFIAS